MGCLCPSGRRQALRPGGVMTRRVTAQQVRQVLSYRLRGIRRVPVVDGQGNLSGIVSADDLLEFLAEEISELSRIGSWQQSHERRVRQ